MTCSHSICDTTPAVLDPEPALALCIGQIVQIVPATDGSGEDEFGSFESTTLSWGLPGSSSILMNTTFKTYSGDDGLIVFEQSFPNDIVNNQTAMAAYKSAQATHTIADNFDECRVVTESSVKLTKSVSGYSAFVPHDANAATARTYDAHKGYYCDDEHKWAYTANVNSTVCQAKCDELKCTCFDVSDSAPTPGSDTNAQSAFPAFSRTSPLGKDLDTFAYHGVFPTMLLTSMSRFVGSSEGGAPIVFYDSEDSDLPMLVFSPLNTPKAQHVSTTSDYIGAGVKARVELTPAGWTQKYLLSAGKGIRSGMLAWGDRVLKFTNKSRADMYLDQTHSTIGFWTDNGGYYHYSTGTNKSVIYEEVLPEVKAYHDSIGVPFGHWQFDSWFYPKDGGVGPGGGGGAVTNWTALPSVFPSGMAGIQEKLGAGMEGGMPTVMHNRQWSTQSDYIHNLTFEWYTSKYAIPKDPHAFFSWFFKQQEGWGLSMYEQDWMCTEYDGVDALNTNISMGDLWLSGMAAGAAESGRSVQYCMPYPYDVLHASAEPAVTNARATGDYFHADNQWSVPNTAMFYWAIGVLPFKDGFYSSNNPQIGGQTVGPETSPDREIIMVCCYLPVLLSRVGADLRNSEMTGMCSFCLLVLLQATLSCAMVGPMDGIHLLNKTRTMASCRGDGLVLKPDQPIMTSDVCFKQRFTGCHVSHTFSNVAQLANPTVHYLFSSEETTITDAHFGLDASSDKYALYNFYTGKAALLGASNVIDAGYEGHVYVIAAPVNGKLAFVGEPDKYTTASSKRFEHGVVSDGDSTITANVTGSANEAVTVCAVKVADFSLVCESTHFDSASTQTVTLSA